VFFGFKVLVGLRVGGFEYLFKILRRVCGRVEVVVVLLKLLCLVIVKYLKILSVFWSRPCDRQAQLGLMEGPERLPTFEHILGGFVLPLQVGRASQDAKQRGIPVIEARVSSRYATTPSCL